MSCPNAAGTITSSPLPDVSITDRSAALPAAVPDVLLLCEHFMARHILCFHITDKFVLSLSHWPLPDSLNDVVQLQELTLSQSNLARFRQDVHKTPATAVTHTQPHMCINVHKHSYRHTHLSNLSRSNHWLTYQVKRTGFLWGGGVGRGGVVDQIYIYESYILPKHIVVIYNRYRLAASNTLNINVKRIYDKRNKLCSR